MTLTDLYQPVDCGHGIPTGLLLVVPAQYTKPVLIAEKCQTQIQEYFIKRTTNYKCSELQSTCVSRTKKVSCSVPQWPKNKNKEDLKVVRNICNTTAKNNIELYPRAEKKGT